MKKQRKNIGMNKKAPEPPKGRIMKQSINKNELIKEIEREVINKGYFDLTFDEIDIMFPNNNFEDWLSENGFGIQGSDGINTITKNV